MIKNEEITRGLILFKKFYDCLSDPKADRTIWHNWLQKMLWAKQGHDTLKWYFEYDDFIDNHDLRRIFDQAYTVDTIKALHKFKIRKSR